MSGGGCGGYRPPSDRKWGRRDRLPVVNVNWVDAQAYVEWLSEKTREAYRLLSESEWEYVARAGTTGPFHTGTTISTERANYNGQPVEVGSFPANRFGLHDVYGNVWEWVEDCYRDGYAEAPNDGRAWVWNCDKRVLRGGSWSSEPRSLRSAFRSLMDSGDRNNKCGRKKMRAEQRPRAPYCPDAHALNLYLLVSWVQGASLSGRFFRWFFVVVVAWTSRCAGEGLRRTRAPHIPQTSTGTPPCVGAVRWAAGDVPRMGAGGVRVRIPMKVIALDRNTLRVRWGRGRMTGRTRRRCRRRLPREVEFPAPTVDNVRRWRWTAESARPRREAKREGRS